MLKTLPCWLAVALVTLGSHAGTLDKIDHIVVIYGENRGFDHLYGGFPHADGLRKLKPSQYTQTDHLGQIMPHLPPVWDGERGRIGQIDPQFSAQAEPPNAPFSLDAAPYHLKLADETRDLTHRFYQTQEQIHGGKMDRFAAVSDAGGLTMGHYNGVQMRMWQIARRYTLADHFFMAAFGGSFLNHMWLACACTPTFNDAPEKLRAVLNEDGITLKRKAGSPSSALQGPPVFERDGSVTPDGFAINTRQPSYQPSGNAPAKDGDPALADPAQFPLPPQTQPTLGGQLSRKGISWAWYGQSWAAAELDGKQLPDAKRQIIYNNDPGGAAFQAHHQPYNYFVEFAPGTAERMTHLQDGETFLRAIDEGKLPQVAFYKPNGAHNSHPGGDLKVGDDHIADLIERIEKSPQWQRTLVIVTYDENGGFWDHVSPPKADRWGPGPRVPAILISPWVKRGFVDHTVYDTTSIHQLISRRFGLPLLPGVRTQFGDLTAALKH